MAIRLIADLSQLRTACAGQGSIGLVPTMGYLHEGHAALISRSVRECDLTVVSVFINSKQFAPHEDLGLYPRDLNRDLGLAVKAGAQVLFHPDECSMYPERYATTVSVGDVSVPLEGVARPGHFDGVATVVLKLLNLVQPNLVYFGEKDWQQLAVVRRMVRDLNVPVEVVGVPTVRDSLGLALSSRNSYLTQDQQKEAVILSRALNAVQHAAALGERKVSELCQAGLEVLKRCPNVQLDYLVVVGEDMQEKEEVVANDSARVLLAARIFGVRLIDNVSLWPQDA